MRLLIDTDPGIDDALALCLALGQEGMPVEGITTVAGNVTVDLGTANVGRILDVLDPASRPRIARGAAAPLRRPLQSAPHVHGQDGLGNLSLLRRPDGSLRYPASIPTLEMLDGPDLILDLAGRHGPDLVIVALGPLTNLALALQRDAERLRAAGRIVIMGGAVAAPGNVTPAAEFNFYVDPEAAALVLSDRLPIELIPLDVTRQVILHETDLELSLDGVKSDTSRFIREFTAYGFEFARDRSEGGIVLHDPLAVSVALDPSLVSFTPLHVAVECAGELTRGLSLADRRPIDWHRRASPNCHVALDVDARRFLDFFLERLCRVS